MVGILGLGIAREECKRDKRRGARYSLPIPDLIFPSPSVPFCLSFTNFSSLFISFHFNPFLMLSSLCFPYLHILSFPFPFPFLSYPFPFPFPFLSFSYLVDHFLSFLFFFIYHFILSHLI